MPVIYSFEAKSIQSYILDSNKLRDMVAASEQIEDITADNGLLDKVLKTLNLQKIKFSRKAGGAFIAILDKLEEAKNLRDLWTYTIRHQLPGLEFVQGLQEYQTDKEILTAEKAVANQKRDDRNRLYPNLPIAGPLIARSPRTGEPAITERPNPKNENGTERLDKATLLKRRFMENTKSRLESKALAKDKFIWPKNLESQDNQKEEQHFPLLEENRYIGIIHADGNGLGELLMQIRKDIKDIPQHYAKVFSKLSKTIEDATIAATNQAILEELVPHAEERNNLKIMPARPLVLGGDDLTIIVRGDLAIPFTAKFLAAFEEITEKLFTDFKKEYKQKHKIDLHLPKGLTACAGIAFIKVSQPFYMAYQLAESLCKTAKTSSKDEKAKSKDKRIASSLSFHRITTSMIDDYNSICKRELTTPTENWLLTMQAYAVGKITPACHFPRLEELDKLRKMLTDEKVSYGAIRELLSLLHLSRNRAERAYKRWRENMAKSQKQGLTEFEKVLSNLVGKADEQLPILTAKENTQQRTPLADALAWKGISTK